MLTIRGDHLIWRAAEDAEPPDAEGAFVRLFPPASAPEELVRSVAAMYRRRGCTVRVMPRAADNRAVPAEQEPAREEKPLRAVVDEMVAEARTEDRAALAAECARAMDEEGL